MCPIFSATIVETFYYFLIIAHHYLSISQTIYVALKFPEQIKKSPADIGNTKYVYNSEKQVSEAGLGVSRILSKYSVMCVCIGSSIGKVGLTIKEKSSTNQQINSIICNSDFNPVYIYYLMSQISEYWKSYATFGPVPILNKGQFEQIEIAGTRNMGEQNEIANSISVLDLKIEFHDTKKQTLTTLFKTLLHELMTGQRRVHELEFEKMEDFNTL